MKQITKMHLKFRNSEEAVILKSYVPLCVQLTFREITNEHKEP